MRQRLEAQLIAWAWRDEAFARELRRDPEAAVEQELGKLQRGAKLPANLEVRVVEEVPTTLYLVLPAMPPRDGTEPSDEDLDQAAGEQGI